MSREQAVQEFTTTLMSKLSKLIVLEIIAARMEFLVNTCVWHYNIVFVGSGWQVSLIRLKNA